jgi:hypothetical protein
MKATKGKKQGTRTRPTKAHADAMRAAGEEWCAPTHVEHIAEYSFEIDSEHEHYDGIFWEGTLYKGDRPILHVEDRGDGGPLRFDPSLEATYEDNREWRVLHEEFVRADKEWENDGRAVSFLDAIANYR